MDELTRFDYEEQENMKTVMQIAKIYSNNKCKYCCGRGYLLFDMIDKQNPKQKYLRYCYCSQKAMKKYK